MSLKALADAVLRRNPARNSCATADKKARNFLFAEVAQLSKGLPNGEVQERAASEVGEKVHCCRCKNVRMTELVVQGAGPRYFWFCARGHLEHGRTIPELRNLLAPESCIKAVDYMPIALTADAASNN